jgi:hypothetical protein
MYSHFSQSPRAGSRTIGLKPFDAILKYQFRYRIQPHIAAKTEYEHCKQLFVTLLEVPVDRTDEVCSYIGLVALT